MLNVLNCTLPPIGIILIISYFLHRKEYLAGTLPKRAVNWFAIAGVVLGAAVANLVKWGIPSINGMIVSAACFFVGYIIEKSRNQS